jgi:Saccharopine dehydrogenase NADP binding domain
LSPVIAVLGATGSLGSEAARELHRLGAIPLLCGRDRGRLEAIAAELPGSRVELVDSADPAALRRLCDSAAVVLNAARYSEGLAEAALEAGRHLVDATAFPLERWRDRSPELAARGATWIVHVGWLPGLPEVVGACAEALATQRFGSAQVEIYAFDRNAYKGVGLADMVAAFFRRPGLLDLWHRLLGRPAGPPERSIQVPTGGSRLLRMPDPIGWKLCTQMQLGGHHPLYIAFDAALLPAMLASLWVGRTRSAEWMATEVVGPLGRRWVEREGPAEVVRARARGPAGQRLTVDFVETGRPGYWLSGAIPAAAALLLARGQAPGRGITGLDRALPAEELMAALREVGVELQVQEG